MADITSSFGDATRWRLPSVSPSSVTGKHRRGATQWRLPLEPRPPEMSIDSCTGRRRQLRIRKQKELNELGLNTTALDPEVRVILQKELQNSNVSKLRRIVLPKVIEAKKAGNGQADALPQLHEHTFAPSPPVQIAHDYATPVAPEAGMLTFMPQADENYEIFDGIPISLREISVANIRYSDSGTGQQVRGSQNSVIQWTSRGVV
ncbi:hypothetical protein PR202_gb10548 [Eleusine coracana subsp. coracana]|uniref:Uncharacterized protein n=1 Tax=Eleusine coracana subsp. coracana TaxID=191504 RepID=A0AAV5EJK1_ELECO|nr:hypothetical protein PR202_gb10548 [Eleusine coracana subsp. coracana]